ncbi:MAG: hypothetical protein HQK60_07060 [Deltaproteobacteria bacterium]|nr:hypothetical protein [Deltaproteobacteria bacterium]
MALYDAEAKHIFLKYGLSKGPGKDFDFAYFPKYSDLLENFRVGKIHITMISIFDAVIAIQKNGVPFKMIGIPVDNTGFDKVESRNGFKFDPTKKYKVAYLKGTSSEFMVEKFLEAMNHPNLPREHVPKGYDETFCALKEDVIDIGVITSFEKDSKLSTLFSTANYTLPNLWVVKDDLLKSRPDFIGKLFQVWEDIEKEIDTNPGLFVDYMCQLFQPEQRSCESGVPENTDCDDNRKKSLRSLLDRDAPLLSMKETSSRYWEEYGEKDVRRKGRDIAEFLLKQNISKEEEHRLKDFRDNPKNWFDTSWLVKAGFLPPPKKGIAYYLAKIRLNFKAYAVRAIAGLACLFIIYVGIITIKKLVGARRKAKDINHDVFVPIKNTYVVGNPIKGREMFFGREEDFRGVQNCIVNDGFKVILLKGGRRCGKTSILNQILDGRLSAVGEAVFCDFHHIAPLVKTDQDLAFQIGEAILTIEPFHDLGNVFHQSDRSWTANLGKLARACLNKIHPKKILILCDEYEAIEELFGSGPLTPVGLMWAKDLLTLPIHFILTGSRPFGDVLGPVFNSVSQQLEISLLTKKDTLELICRPVKGALEYRGKTAETIYRLSGGHPFYTQYICQALINHINANVHRRHVMPDDINETINFIIRNPAGHIQETWKSLPRKNKSTLAVLANTIKNEADYVRESSCLKTIQRCRFDIEAQEYRESIAWLKRETQLLDWEPNRIRFKQDIIRYWVRYYFQTGEQMAEQR